MALLKISRSILRVAERVLGLTGTPLPTEILERIQLGFEARAIRPWELYDEGIIAWHRNFQVAAAGAGRFSGFQIWAGGLQASQLPALGIITRIENESSTAIDVRVDSAAQAWANNVAGGVFPRDTRWGTEIEILNGMVSGGDLAAAPGVIIGGTFGPQEAKVVELVNEIRVGSASGFVFMNGTANTAISVDVDGLVIPKYR